MSKPSRRPNRRNRRNRHDRTSGHGSMVHNRHDRPLPELPWTVMLIGEQVNCDCGDDHYHSHGHGQLPPGVEPFADFGYTIGLHNLGFPELHLPAHPDGAGTPMPYRDLGDWINGLAIQLTKGTIVPGTVVRDRRSGIVFRLGPPGPIDAVSAFQCDDDALCIPVRWSVGPAAPVGHTHTMMPFAAMSPTDRADFIEHCCERFHPHYETTRAALSDETWRRVREVFVAVVDDDTSERRFNQMDADLIAYLKTLAEEESLAGSGLVMILTSTLEQMPGDACTCTDFAKAMIDRYGDGGHE